MTTKLRIILVKSDGKPEALGDISLEATGDAAKESARVYVARTQASRRLRSLNWAPDRDGPDLLLCYLEEGKRI